ncbi:MAG TPA: molybdopterin molybdotransferase MoeA [Rhizomicrobium sp.]
MTISTTCLDGKLPTVAEALALVAPLLSPVTQNEQVPLDRAAGRSLARDVTAPTTVPPWPRAAMDGFAFRSGSGAPLKLVGTATAAKPFGGSVQLGECVTISTGARVPEGCDTVAMREHCSPEGDKVWLGALLKRGAHVRARGEDYGEGAVLLTAGTGLDARAIALLASAGIAHVAVHRRLRVAIFSAGDELKTGSIRDSNRAMLTALLAGAEMSDLGILADRQGDIQAALSRAAASHDVILSTAGTSMGEEDHVRAAILGAGGRILVSGVAIKPGKPVTIARIGKALHIALPGNPVAAFATFLALGAPLLRRLSGARERPAPLHAVQAAFTHRKKKGVREYLRVRLEDGDGALPHAMPAGSGSAQLFSLAHCDGLLCLDDAVGDVAEGDILPCLVFSERDA